MKIVLQFEPVTVTDSDGNTVFEAPLFDLSILMGNAINQAISSGVAQSDHRALYEAVAAALNVEYKTELFTWGSASSLSTQVNAAVNELKKNGRLADSPQQSSTEKK